MIGLSLVMKQFFVVIFQMTMIDFGQPGKGIHSSRFLGLAKIDLLLTALMALVIGLMIQKCVVTTFIILFMIGQVVHLVFKVKTAFIVAILNLMGKIKICY